MTAQATAGAVSSMELLIFGCGFSGRAIGERLSRAGAKVTGTTRSRERFDDLQVRGIAPIIFDGEHPHEDVTRALATATHVVVSIAPGPSGDPVIAHYAEALKSAAHLEWIGYLSTVGVYGNHDGGWVDEDTVPKPVSERSRQRVEAENLWMTVAVERGLPISIERLSGIYGPGRNALETLRAGKARRLVKPGQVFNRIHVNDIAGATELLARERYNGIVNVTDDEPAPPQDVVTYAAELEGVSPPDEIDFDSADLTPMARSFYGENKRVSNARLRSQGYDLAYPTYREGLESVRGASATERDS